MTAAARFGGAASDTSFDEGGDSAGRSVFTNSTAGRESKAEESNEGVADRGLSTTPGSSRGTVAGTGVVAPVEVNALRPVELGLNSLPLENEGPSVRVAVIVLRLDGCDLSAGAL